MFHSLTGTFRSAPNAARASIELIRNAVTGGMDAESYSAVNRLPAERCVIKATEWFDEMLLKC